MEIQTLFIGLQSVKTKNENTKNKTQEIETQRLSLNNDF